MRLEPDGTLSWIKPYHFGVDTRWGVVDVAEDGDLLLGGTTLGSVIVDADGVGADLFFARLCPEGNVRTLMQWGPGDDDWSRGITEDAEGNVLIAGETTVEIPDGSGNRRAEAFIVTVSPE